MLDIIEELERVETYTALALPLIEELNRLIEDAEQNPDEATALLASVFAAGSLAGMVLAYKSVLAGIPINLDGMIPDSPEGLT
jgi:hypothetical protein